MKIVEFVPSSDITSLLTFHKELNPKLWENGELRLEVRVHLLRIAREFYKFLALTGLHLVDVIFTGSNAAFNYTEHSDIDVHLIVDFEKSGCPNLADNFFNAKRTLWNQSHDI